jgi:hypothetical protein
MQFGARRFDQGSSDQNTLTLSPARDCASCTDLPVTEMPVHENVIFVYEELRVTEAKKMGHSARKEALHVRNNYLANRDLTYPSITYYWTVPLILDHSYLVRYLKNSKIGETKVLEPLKS